MKENEIEYLSLVQFDTTNMDVEVIKQYPFKEDHAYVWFGEIPNMPGHCVVMDMATNKFYTGFHCGTFKILRAELV